MPVLDFADDDMHVLNAALGQMPYARVAGLIQKINKQLVEQTDASPPEDQPV